MNIGEDIVLDHVRKGLEMTEIGQGVKATDTRRRRSHQALEGGTNSGESEMAASSVDKMEEMERKLVKQQLCWNEDNRGSTLRTQTLASFTAKSEGVRGMTGGAMVEVLCNDLGASTVGENESTTVKKSGVERAKVVNVQQFMAGV